MQATNCQQVKDALVDYIELEVLNNERERITKHLAECAQCRQEFDELANLLGSLPRASVPDPGDAYWATLPAQVLSAVKRKKNDQTEQLNNVIDLSTVRSTLQAKQTEQRTASKTKALQRRIIIPLAASILMAVGVVALMPGFEDMQIDVAELQRSLANSPNLDSALLRLSSDDVQPMSRFGFIEQGRTTTNFALGSSYVMALAFSISGDLQSAEQNFSSLRGGLEQLGWSKPDLETLHSDADASHIAAWPAQIEAYLAKNKSVLESLYFRTGVWSTGSLLLSATDSLQTQAEKARLAVLIKALKNHAAPSGVVAVLEEMQLLLVDEKLTEREAKQYFRALQTLNGLMG